MAASIKMRKCNTGRSSFRRDTSLQCGRIYKDAEIVSLDISPVNKDNLQCGRIYKDAEIAWAKDRTAFVADYLQCGRIYKDAEMCNVRGY